MKSLDEIKRELFADGKITADEVEHLRNMLFDEEGMTKEKGDILFEIKNTISPEHRIEEFNNMFVESITNLLLEDEVSPGEIDDSEAKWLRAKIQAKGYRDSLDSALLDSLKDKSINFPEILNYKSKVARRFENCLYFSRYLTIFAVIASITSAIVLFIKGTMVALNTLLDFVASLFQAPSISLNSSAESKFSEYEGLLVGFISSVDIYLFAMVLIIFGMGIYELFISKIDPVERKVDSRPSWLQISSIDDLKSSLGKVILMVLIVTFFKYTIHINFQSALDLLFLAIGIVLISFALFIANKSKN